jgi:hypothetical protein
VVHGEEICPNPGNVKLWESPSRAGGLPLINYEQFEAEAKNFQTPSYTAGTASFYTELSYNKGDSVPLLETNAKEYVVQALNDICQKNLHAPIDSSKLSFKYENDHDTDGDDIGDLVLHPYLAYKERAIKLTGSAVCLSDKDEAVEALKHNDPHLFDQRQSSSYDGLTTPKEVTARFAFYSVTPTGVVTALKGDEVPSLTLTDRLYKSRLLEPNYVKTSSIPMKKIMVDANGAIYAKIDFSEIVATATSWSAGDSLVLNFNGLTSELRDTDYDDNLFDKTSVWNDAASHMIDSENGVLPTCRLNDNVGVLDCRIFVKSEK